MPRWWSSRLVAVAVLAVRRRVITRRGGTFDCSLRLRPARSGKGWALGIGRYAGDSLEWYRVFSYATRPRRVMARRELEIVDRRVPRARRSSRCWPARSSCAVARAATPAAILEFAMGEDALTGFLSWLEAAPPAGVG